jgi:hypothetical protein
MTNGKRPDEPNNADDGAPDKTASVAGDPGTNERSRRSRRPAPTIDLTAKEIPGEAAAEPQPDAAASDTGRFDAPPNDRGAGSPRFASRDGISVTTIAAGLAGGLLVSIVLFVLWLTGTVPIRYAGTTAMRARVSTLEMQVSELTKANSGTDAKLADELTQRVAKLEQAAQGSAQGSAQASADPKLLERLDAAENAMKALGVAIAALTSRVEANGARVDAAEKATADINRASASSDGALSRRVEALEKSVAEASASVAKARTDERAARFAVAASALRDVVVSGEPFANELAAVKSLGAQSDALAPLASFAAQGVPGDAALAKELSALIPSLQKLAGAPTETAQGAGFLDKLQANAAKLVRVRPAGEAAGSDPVSQVARIEQFAARGDVAAAQKELASLPAAIRAPADAWLKKLDARRAAIDASRKLAADSVRALP